MGRYYEGDIEGKFWFGVQDSDDGEFFGAEPQESNYIDYCVTKEDLKDSKGMATVKKQLTFQHKGKKLKYWELHDQWNFVIDKWMVDNKDTKEQWQYISFEKWLLEEHGIGSGKNGMQDIIDSGMRGIYILLARHDLGRKMVDFFKDNPDRDELYYNAEC